MSRDVMKMALEAIDAAMSENDFHRQMSKPVLIALGESATQLRAALRSALAQPEPAPEPQGEPVALVLAEVAKATQKFPTWPTDPLHALAVLGEEYGELNKAVLQFVYEPHKTSADEIRTEAIQTAAMALRFLASLDRYQYTPGNQHHQAPLYTRPQRELSEQNIREECAREILAMSSRWPDDRARYVASECAKTLMEQCKK